MKTWKGHKINHHFSFNQEDVEKFMEITGDKNRIHWDTTYAATTIFKKPILHGMLSITAFTKIFGTIFPKEGTIYLTQNNKFLKPMFAGVLYSAEIEVIEEDVEKCRLTIATNIFEVATRSQTVAGEAQLLNKEIYQ